MHKGIDRLQFTIITTWLLFTFLGLAYFTFERLSEFDPNGVLVNTTRSQFIENLVKVNNTLKNPKTLIHFYESNCSCNKVSDIHVAEIKSIATKNNFTFKSIEIDNPLVIPSTPSIAIIDSTGELVYFGPYGEGLGCSKTDGYALTVFKNLLQGYSANLIVNTAQGCYCNS